MNQNVADLLLAKYGKKNPPAVKPGDTVRVHQKIKEGDKERIQVFEGLVIATKHGNGLDGSFTVRKIAVGGIGVERTYPVHSPNVVKVERIKNAAVSRAKLYYMRDRKGKAARFKGEVRSFMTWAEGMAPAEGEVVEAPMDGVTEVTDTMVEVQPEGTVEAEALASAEATTPVADEAVEVEEAAVEAAADQEKAEDKAA
jgi:large subunit ribosomal protein L19